MDIFIRKSPVQTFVERYYCKDCDVELKHDGTGRINAVGRCVVHRCSKCGGQETLNDYYPRVVNQWDE